MNTVKAILNNELIILNEVPPNAKVNAAQVTDYKGIKYFNPDNAEISPDADKEYFKMLTKRKAALAKNSFDKGDVVDALIDLGQWTTLKTLMLDPANERIKDRWDTHSVIKLNDPDVDTAVKAIGLDTDTIKLTIAGIIN